MIKKIIAIFFIFCSPILLLAQTGKSGHKIKTIIIDAGHGGRDPGAEGEYSTEAKITLQLALKLNEVLKDQLPDTKLIMERTTDVFQNVREKASFANQNNGDLFVCNHVNYAPKIRHQQQTGTRTVTYYTGKGKKRKKHTKKEPVYKVWYTPNPREGTETYVWAADRADNKAQEIIENERFESSEEVNDVPDPESPEALIKARLWTQKFFKGSVRLATMVESEFAKIGRNSGGVKQRNEKGIWVLQATAMPSVLIETGFISNKEEEDFLNSEAGQTAMVGAIANAIVAYKTQVEAPRNNILGDSTTDAPQSNTSRQPSKESNAINQPQKPLAVMPKKR